MLPLVFVGLLKECFVLFLNDEQSIKEGLLTSRYVVFILHDDTPGRGGYSRSSFTLMY